MSGDLADPNWWEDGELEETRDFLTDQRLLRRLREFIAEGRTAEALELFDRMVKP